MSEVLLENLRKVYNANAREPFVALEGLTLPIASGELAVLVGPSGCGKTSTLRMIAGLEEVTSGDIRIGGRRMNDFAPKDRDIAMVFQNYALYPHMTVRENLEFGMRMRGVKAAERSSKVADVSRALGLESLLARLPKELSGGQRQRVALGRAIVRQPAVFLFDEPLSNLDAQMRVAMRAEISALHRRLGATMVYVTHDQVEAMTLGTRICVMERGRLRQWGAPADVYRRPANRFVAGFIGSPPMNLVEGELVADGGAPRFRCAAGEIRVPVAAWPGWKVGRVTLGFRPEHAQVGDEGLGCDVRVCELLGHESVVYASARGIELAVRVPVGGEPAPGSSFRVRPRDDGWHFFECGGDGPRLN